MKVLSGSVFPGAFEPVVWMLQAVAREWILAVEVEVHCSAVYSVVAFNHLISYKPTRPPQTSDFPPGSSDVDEEICTAW